MAATETRRLRIAEQADQVRPTQVAVTVVTAVFVAIGWTAGALWKYALVSVCIGLWRAVAYCGAAVRFGYRCHARVPVQAVQPPQELLRVVMLVPVLRGRPGMTGRHETDHTSIGATTA